MPLDSKPNRDVCKILPSLADIRGAVQEAVEDAINFGMNFLVAPKDTWRDLRGRVRAKLGMTK